jgi:hypothetical protein
MENTGFRISESTNLNREATLPKNRGLSQNICFWFSYIENRRSMQEKIDHFFSLIQIVVKCV